MAAISPEIDAAGLLALSGHNEQATSHLDGPSLQALLAQAFHVGLREQGRTAFLIAFDQDAHYDSPNFHWFRDRYPRFVYVDRVVVSDGARGQGIARTLYEALFAASRSAGHELVCCEVNLVPANPGSHAFHEALGFGEVGRGSPDGGAKRVRYLVHRLAPTDTLR